MVNSKSYVIGLTLICPILFLPSLVHSDYAQAADCSSKACIDVYIQDGHIVIEAHKGAGPKSHTAKKSAPKARPQLKAVPRPSPKTTPKATSHYTLPKKSVPRRSVPRKVVRKVAPTVSLNEKLFKLIPTGKIAYEPASNALVNIPVIYWCDLPGIFSTKVAIIGEVVDVTMRPAFLWSFGDGTFFATTSPGAAYPHQIISHTYSKAGRYAVALLVTWGGIWSNNGVARAITGEIRKVSIATITVANAPTRLTQ